LHKGIGQLESLASLDPEPQTPTSPACQTEIGNLSKLWEMPLDGLKLSLDAFAYPRSNQGPPHAGRFGGRGKTSLLRAHDEAENSPRDSRRRRGHRRHAVVVPPATTASPEVGDLPAELLGLCRGQEEFYATHQCFLSQRAIYLLIYSLQWKAATSEAPPTEALAAVNIKAPGPAVLHLRRHHATPCPSSGPTRDTIIREYYSNKNRDNDSSTRLRRDCRIRGEDLSVLQWYQLRKMATDAGLNMNDEKLSQLSDSCTRAACWLHFDIQPTGSTIYRRQIDVVIEEWYPGLTDRTFARQSLSNSSSKQPHQARSSSSAVVFHTFSFDDIVNEAGIARGNPVSRFAADRTSRARAVEQSGAGCYVERFGG
uniref:Homeobox domain-containing protein n=1 Tax=Macrostomum lignano TaxID=282301 RepID=A0A1I8FCL2_9PLAT